MSERLEELRRQRALLAQHLAWLDQEIAQAEVAPPSPLRAMPEPPRAPAMPTMPTMPMMPVAMAADVTSAISLNTGRPAERSTTLAANAPMPPTPAPGATEPAAEQIMDEFRVAPENVTADVRKGCLLYFALAFVLLGLGVAALWWLFRR